MKTTVHLSIYDKAQLHKELRDVKLKNDGFISFILPQGNQPDVLLSGGNGGPSSSLKTW
jgi:hypothetical protein